MYSSSSLVSVCTCLLSALWRAVPFFAALLYNLALSCPLHARPLPPLSPAIDIAMLLDDISGQEQTEEQNRFHYACLTSDMRYGLELVAKSGNVLCRYIDSRGNTAFTDDFLPLFEDYDELIDASKDFLKENNSIAPNFWTLTSNGLAYSQGANGEHVLISRETRSGSGSESSSGFGPDLNSENGTQPEQSPAPTQGRNHSIDGLATAGGVLLIVLTVGIVAGLLIAVGKFDCIQKINDRL